MWLVIKEKEVKITVNFIVKVYISETEWQNYSHTQINSNSEWLCKLNLKPDLIYSHTLYNYSPITTLNILKSPTTHK